MGKPRHHGFTLAEMLTVLVIIAIMLSIAIPAVTNLNKASALTSAAREVSNALGLARQYAILHRTRARVVFPYSGTIQTPGADLAPHYVSYAVMSIDIQSGRVNYISKWEHLPTGVVFLTNDLAGDIGNLPSDPRPFPYTNSPLAQLAYIEFHPMGAASQPSAFGMIDGFIDNNGFPQPTAPYNSVRSVVDNIIGRIQVIRP